MTQDQYPIAGIRYPIRGIAGDLTTEERAEVLREVEEDCLSGFAKMSIVTADGVEEEGYKERALLNRDDYCQLLKFHAKRSFYHEEMYRFYSVRCAELYAEQVRDG